MANRVVPTPTDADNSYGSFTPAARSVWRSVRRFHVGTGHTEPTLDAGYTTAGSPLLPKPISLFLLGGSPYTRVRSHSPIHRDKCRLASNRDDAYEVREHNLHYSGTASPEPPISFGTSFSFGNPSLMRNTVSW